MAAYDSTPLDGYALNGNPCVFTFTGIDSAFVTDDPSLQITFSGPPNSPSALVPPFGVFRVFTGCDSGGRGGTFLTTIDTSGSHAIDSKVITKAIPLAQAIAGTSGASLRVSLWPQAGEQAYFVAQLTGTLT